jgi:hypothetical protein
MNNQGKADRPWSLSHENNERMYSRTSEPVKFERDCSAVMVPSGDVVNLPAGSVGYITQALGGSFTVYVEGNLFRIAGSDADAIGKTPLPLPALSDGASDADVEALVWDQLRTMTRRSRSTWSSWGWSTSATCSASTTTAAEPRSR